MQEREGEGICFKRQDKEVEKDLREMKCGCSPNGGEGKEEAKEWGDSAPLQLSDAQTLPAASFDCHLALCKEIPGSHFKPPTEVLYLRWEPRPLQKLPGILLIVW